MIATLFTYAVILALIPILGLASLLFFTKSRVFSRKAAQDPKKTRLAFFHPKCNAGGGGEKVLWCMIEALMNSYSPNDLEIAIYTGGDAPDDEILKKAEDRFLTKLPYKPLFIRLDRDRIIDPDLYPVFTMLGQILGTNILAANALSKYVPDYFVDTTGLAFCYALVKFLVPSCKIGAYVHYPFISHDMLNSVMEKRARVNNSSRIADSPILSRVKIYYYKALLYAYGFMGNRVDFAWGNSTWTSNHIKQVWPKWGKGSQQEIQTLYPPCNVSKFSSLSNSKRKNIVLSFAQYRPEKNHKLQLEVFKAVLDKNPGNDLEFYVIGSCRGGDDDKFLNGLQDYTQELGIKDRVKFFVNLPLNSLLEQFETCSYAIHTMEAEHFGIAIVEMMAAGLAVIAHNSAGPKLDIIRERKENPVGFLAANKEDYIKYLDQCVNSVNTPAFRNLVAGARKDVDKFSDEAFKEIFVKDMKKFLKK